jgi:hypothetical protein
VPERKGLVRTRDVTFDEASTPGIPEEPQHQYFEVTDAEYLRQNPLAISKPVEAQARIQPVQPTVQQDLPSQDSGGEDTELQESSAEQHQEQTPNGRQERQEPLADVHEQELEKRLPARINRGKLPERYATPAILSEPTLFALAAAVEGADTDRTPQNLKEALESPDAHKWMEAMLQEIKALQAMRTWKLVPLPQGYKALPGKWLFKIKFDVNGLPSRYKARWCVRGDKQRYGIDFTETYAAVARSTSFRICMALCAKYGLFCHQMDVITAFLNGEMEPGIDIYVVQPYGFEEGDFVCLLAKALYGLKQSPRLWYERFTKYIRNVLGFDCLNADACLFQRQGVILMLYVDDLLVIASSLNAVNEVKQALATEFSMQDLGAATYYLGIRIVRNEPQGSISLVQDAYARRILTQMGMEHCKATQTPMEHHLHQQEPEGKEAENPEQYQSMVGSLMFLMVQTRPDLAFSVGWLARYCQRPLAMHEQAVKRVLRYLQGSITRGITYTEGSLIGYSDASFAEDPETRRSTSGYLFMLAGGAISWKSSRQELVTTSSTEAEYVGYSSAAKEAAWVRGLLQELNRPAAQMPLYVDNNSGISLAESNAYRARTKHIDVRYHYIRQEVQRGRIELKYLPTEEMPADGLTKPLSRAPFEAFIKGLNLNAVQVH